MTANHAHTPSTEHVRFIYSLDGADREYKAQEFDRWHAAEIAAAEQRGAAKSLRAVLELHKPSELYPAVTPGVIYCVSCWDGVIDEAYEYPCPTAQAISDTLKGTDDD